MYKKPFLALYEKIKIKSANELSIDTESEGETSDVDEYYLDGTLITERLEANNEDNYSLGSTIITDSIEDSDIDNFIIDL